MAVNALGQTIQLLLNQAPQNDMTLGLKAGDILQGRLVEILPDNRGIVQIKGQNLLAQLPPAQAGQIFSKGVLLDLAVLQSQPKNSPPVTGSGPQASPSPPTAAQGAPSPTPPALTLKLLGISTQPAQGALISKAGLDQTAAPLPQPTLEALVSAAKLPVTSANLQAAQSLGRYGMPVNSTTISQVIQTAEAMIQVETPEAPAPQIQVLPPQLSQGLNEARTLLNVVASQPDRAAERPQIQSLIRAIDDFIASPAPQASQAPAAETLQPRFSSIVEIKAAMDNALNQVSDARPNALQNFSTLLEDIKITLPRMPLHESAPAPAAAPDKGILNAMPALALASSAAPETHPAFNVTLKREIGVALKQALAPLILKGDATQSAVIDAIDLLAAELDIPQAPRPQAILQSATNQAPELAPGPRETLAQVKTALADIKNAFVGAPLPKPVRSMASLNLEFETRDIPGSTISLASLPKETVIEAVAFLKARQVAPTRPAVEAVASQLNEGGDLGQQLEMVINSRADLPQGLLDLQPKLTREFENLSNFLNQYGIRPEGKNVASQIRDFVLRTGLNMEKDLLALSDDPHQAAPQGQGPAQPPADTLKAALLKVQESVREASSHPVAQASPELSGKLEAISGHLDAAINSIHTLQLAARPTPAFDVTTVQLPVFFGGQVQSGQLSIYWKKGRAHEINATDPVNVVFLLNTRGLGEVKVQLQVWKDECQCRVSVGNEEARRFIEAEAPELEKNFAENTPFKLSMLDISGALSPLKRALDFVEDVASRNAFGLNLTA